MMLRFVIAVLFALVVSTGTVACGSGGGNPQASGGVGY
jgi:hypothetical protein